MQYGINEESAARGAFEKATNRKILLTGLWLNINFPAFAASPGGLIKDKFGELVGIAEIKCLKILRMRTVDELIKCSKEGSIQRMTLNQQCFRIVTLNSSLIQGFSDWFTILKH